MTASSSHSTTTATSQDQQRQQQRQKLSSWIPSRRGTLLTCVRTAAATTATTPTTADNNNILVVAFHRPRVKNAFNEALYLDLVDVLYEAEHDESIAALVLTGTGTYFSSGADLKEMLQILSSNPKSKLNSSLSGIIRDDAGDDDPSSSNFINSNHRPQSSSSSPPPPPVRQFMMALLQFPKVLVAAVNGPAVGIAVTLLFHCDLVVCSPNATFWTPFTRLALVPEFCSSVTMPETMGLSKANEMLLLGTKINAETALAWNVVSRIIPISSSSPSPSPSSSVPNKQNVVLVGGGDDVDDSCPLAFHICHELQEQLLSLPLGADTAKLFVSMMRGGGGIPNKKRRQERLIQICQEELRQLDERFEQGHVLQAVMQLSMGGGGGGTTATTTKRNSKL